MHFVYELVTFMRLVLDGWNSFTLNPPTQPPNCYPSNSSHSQSHSSVQWLLYCCTGHAHYVELVFRWQILFDGWNSFTLNPPTQPPNCYPSNSSHSQSHSSVQWLHSRTAHYVESVFRWQIITSSSHSQSHSSVQWLHRPSTHYLELVFRWPVQSAMQSLHRTVWLLLDG